MTPKFELFHRIADGGCARVRKRLVELGLEGPASFRNVHYDVAREALAAHGIDVVPAIWDGERLHVGEAACLAFLEDAAR